MSRFSLRLTQVESDKLKLLQFLVLTTILSALGAVAINSGFVNAQNSSEKKQNPNLVRQLNFLIPPSGAVSYVVLPPGGNITGRLGLSAAQLIDPPAELAQEVAVMVPEAKLKDPKGKVISSEPPVPPNAIAYEFISSTRYRGNGHTIFVTTARMSPAAAKLKHSFGKPDKLADGTAVGITVACESLPSDSLEGDSCVESSPTPNRVVFMRGNLIVTVASDLPIEQVKSLAKNASLK